jgi:DNA-binding NtrC family response regulator
MFSILFVSHDADLCAAAGRALQRAGLSARTAAHAGHASLACAETQFDVLVIENEMPEGSGKRIAARLRRYCPDLGVVVMCDRRSIVPADEIAVVRPFMADDLVEAILAALAGRQARRGATSR